MPYYTIQQGDTLAKVARDFGLANWKRIYSHPDNADLRLKRTNPNLLHPGDVVFVPEPEIRTDPATSDQRHRYIHLRPKQVLRLAVEDKDGNRIKNTPFDLVIGSELHKGHTDGNGMIEQEVPINASSAVLKVSDYKWVLAIGHLNPLHAGTPDGGVSGAQGRLLNLGYPVGPVDGILGPRTREALRYFQADERIPVTGELDAATIAKLLEVHGV